MTRPLPQIDHLVINVSHQLDASVAHYARLGFQLTPRGHHSLGSSNHLAIFGQDYIELLGYEPHNAERAASHWGAQQGLAGLVFKTREADALFQTLSAQGVRLEGNEPKAFFRPISLPDGSTQEVRFRTVRLDPEAVSSGRIFFCQHLDPNLVWRKVWQVHPNGVRAIKQVVIEAEHPTTSIGLLQKTFGTAATQAIDGGWRLKTASGAVDYLSPDAVRARFSDTTAPREAGKDRKVAVVLETASLNRARAALQTGDIAVQEGPAGELIVPAAQAFGVALVFAESGQ